MPAREVSFQDISLPDHGVQITVRDDGAVVWISVDGITVLRVSQIPHLEVNLPGIEVITFGEEESEE